MIGGDSEKGLMEDPAMVYYLDIRKFPLNIPPSESHDGLCYTMMFNT